MESYNWRDVLSQHLEGNAYEVSRLLQFGRKELFQIKCFKLFVCVETGWRIIYHWSFKPRNQKPQLSLWSEVVLKAIVTQFSEFGHGDEANALCLDSYSKPQEVSM